jgi:hypothetical protein
LSEPGDFALSVNSFVASLHIVEFYRLYSIIKPMRPKARGLAQHGGPPGWLEEIDPAGCDFVVPAL